MTTDPGLPPAPRILPPQSLEAEQSVLGAVLLSDQTLYALRIEIALVPDDFYRPSHAAIYAAMLALYEQSEPVDKLTVVEKLKQLGQLDAAGGAAAIEGLAAAPPVVGTAAQYGSIVKSTARERRYASLVGPATVTAVKAKPHRHVARTRPTRTARIRCASRTRTTRTTTSRVTASSSDDPGPAEPPAGHKRPALYTFGCIPPEARS